MKKIICALMALSIAWCLCGCEENSKSIPTPTPTPTPTTTPILEDKNIHIRFWVDEETGVQYLIWRDSYKGGITPRLNADGTLYHPTEKGGVDNGR